VTARVIALTNVQTVRGNIPVGRLTHLHTVAITVRPPLSLTPFTLQKAQ
jgi:hypothetical protein